MFKGNVTNVVKRLVASNFFNNVLYSLLEANSLLEASDTARYLTENTIHLTIPAYEYFPNSEIAKNLAILSKIEVECQ